MKTYPTLCESCKTLPVEVLEEADEIPQPYQLCTPCHDRLINAALRPLEYFNLAAIHGHSYYLNDDLYDYTTGEATQPSIDVTEAEKLPFPDLQLIKGELELLVDYACVQYFTGNEVIQLLKELDKKEVLEYLDFKVSYNSAINYKVYEMAAKVLGLFAADWIRLQWNNQKEKELLLFAPALAACLPFDEAFAIVTKEIEQTDRSAFVENSAALLYFQSSQTLEWMEKVKGRIKNVSSTWGVLAAASQFNWPTAQNWLNVGRPLSLMALDALLFCTTKGNRENQALWFQDHPPILYHPESLEVMANALTGYLQKDRVPRTRNAVDQIISNLFSV